jgi:hypothetical protein
MKVFYILYLNKKERSDAIICSAAGGSIDIHHFIGFSS